MRHSCGMEKSHHGNRLKDAMARRNVSNHALADLLGVGVKTVYNWRSGATMPSDTDLTRLRSIFPGYDSPGDEVELAVRRSELTEDRQLTVLATYKRQLREQRESLAG